MTNSSTSSIEENTYDIYDASPNLDESKCPYTGLPAAHLKLMNSPQVGLLTRVGKKMFFAKEKDFYAGILGKWILLYPSKSNDMKPSEYFYPVSIELEKSEHHFSIVTNKRKKFIFHAPNRQEYEGWLDAIRNVIETVNNEPTACQLREKDTMTDQFRKLPSPPLEDDEENTTHDSDDRVSSENYYGFNRSSNRTVIDASIEEERLYEEPTRSTLVEQTIDAIDDENPPTLPLKTGRKTIDDSETHSYDVPKPMKFADTLHINENSPDKSRSRVSEMTAILATSMSLVSPEEMRKSTTPTKKQPIPVECQDPQEKRVSPMKVWFTKHIKMRRRQKVREITPEIEDELPCDAAKIITVNSIVNMFEKNGHFKNLSKNLKLKDDDYETVSFKTCA